MPFNGLLEPEQLTILCEVLEEHCLAKNIRDELGRKVVACRLMFLVMKGINSAEKLRSALNDESGRERSHFNQIAARS